MSSIPSEPPDMIRMTKSQALEYQWNIVHDWKPKRDVWALLYGPGALGMASGITSIMFNRYYRSKLKLRSFGHVSTYIPIVVMPALFSMFFHRIFIATDIILEEQRCIVCSETKSAMLQTALGVGYPLVMAPAGSYMMANRYNTARIPELSSKKKKFWEFHMSTSKNLFLRIPYVIVIHVIVSTIITYYDYKNYYTISKKIIQQEADMIEQSM